MEQCEFYNRIRLEYSKDSDEIILKPCCIGEIVHTYKSAYFIDNIETCIKDYCNTKDIKNIDCRYSNCNSGNIDTIELSIYKGCNLECIMCHQEHISNLKELDVYIKLMNYFTSKKYNIVSTTLGEPFILKDKMLKWIENSYNMCVITNCTLVTKGYIDELVKYKNKLKILVSLDSVVKDTYEKIRVGANFDTVIDNILYLNKLNLLDKIIYCVQQNNITERKITEKWFSNNNIDYKYVYDLSSNSMDYYNKYWIYYDTRGINIKV